MSFPPQKIVTTFRFHSAKRNQEHCNVAKIGQLLLFILKKNLIIYEKFLFYTLETDKFKTIITKFVSLFA